MGFHRAHFVYDSTYVFACFFVVPRAVEQEAFGA